MLFDIKLGYTIVLPRTGTWPETVHMFEEESIWALRAALAAERPLLIRGEPGSGKSQLARAAAQALGRAFVATVVHSRSESQDLLYQFDAVRRLGEAQALGAAGREIDIQRALDPEQFLSPGPLWWTFDWESAAAQATKCLSPASPPESPVGWQPQQGTVLLIDEIDKADADLPNGLLEILGNGAFSVPFLGRSIGLKAGCPPPLVAITTNEERELPAAFLRRCLVLHLGLPEKDQDLIDYLGKRGRIHFQGQCPDTVYQEAARMLVNDRNEAKKQGLSAPGQAEYLDILRALTRLSQDEAGQIAALKKIAAFALKKHPPDIV